MSNHNLINTRQLVELASKLISDGQFVPGCILRLGVSPKIGTSDRFKATFYARRNRPGDVPAYYGETRYLYRSVNGALKAIRNAVRSLDPSLEHIIEKRI